MSYQKYAADHRVLIVFQENRKETCMSNSWPFLYPSQSISDKIMQIVKKKPAHTESSNYCAIRNHHNQLEKSEKNPMHYTGSALSLLWYKYHWKCQTASRVNWFFIHPNINRWHYAGQTELDYLPCMVHFILVCNSSVKMVDTHWTTTRSAHRYILYFIGEKSKTLGWSVNSVLAHCLEGPRHTTF